VARAAAAGASLFRFVQFEFPWALGPEDGRYVIRGHAGEPEHVLVLATLGAPQRRLIGGRRTRQAAPEPPPQPVATARATLAGAAPFPSPEDAEAWLAGADLEAEAEQAIATLNAVLHAQRLAAADPYIREVARDQALVARLGLGEGEQVAHGRWTDARELPRARGARSTRTAALRPQERFAAVLGGRDVLLACEELVLRARLDVDRGRFREAAFQVRVALEAALAELEPWASRGDLAERLEELRSERAAVGAAANAALQGGLDDRAIADVERALERIEAALRARSASGFD
jgi:hypothetical protein